jgi:hypothetical protein
MNLLHQPKSNSKSGRYKKGLNYSLIGQKKVGAYII